MAEGGRSQKNLRPVLLRDGGKHSLPRYHPYLRSKTHTPAPDSAFSLNAGQTAGPTVPKGRFSLRLRDHIPPAPWEHFHQPCPLYAASPGYSCPSQPLYKGYYTVSPSLLSRTEKSRLPKWQTALERASGFAPLSLAGKASGLKVSPHPLGLEVGFEPTTYALRMRCSTD